MVILASCEILISFFLGQQALFVVYCYIIHGSVYVYLLWGNFFFSKDRDYTKWHSPSKWLSTNSMETYSSTERAASIKETAYC